MQKRIMIFLVCLSITVLLSGCGAMVMAPGTGFLYTEVKAPLTATSNSASSKVGTSQCTSILGLICTGDASIQTAAKNAGITRIHHVDYKNKSILGIYAELTVTVYGD